MRIVFWGKYVDTYLTDTLRCYGELIAEPVRYVLVEESFTRRSVPSEPASGQFNLSTILQKHHFFKQSSRVLQENPGAVHVFLSFWGDKRLFRVLLGALRRGQRVAVLFEPFATEPVGYWKDEGRLPSLLKVWGRRIAYRGLWSMMRLAARGRLPCVLAVSPLAEEQLRVVGFRDDVIYPFGYFVEKKSVEPAPVEGAKALRVVFSGSLIKRKGVDIAIAAVRQVNIQGVRVLLDIYGPGEIEKYLPQEIPGIRYRGFYLQEDAQKVISGYDLLLVPSRHEGWGLVVNEALMQGVPVLASDRVGAGCLLEKSGAGCVFRNGDVVELSQYLNDLASDRARLKEMAAACEGVRERLTPEMGADYLKKVLEYHFDETGTRPQAGWLTF